MKQRTLSEPRDVLYRIKRGLAGYVSYLAACEMNESFSEYILYEPILRILTARGYTVRCEEPCPGITHKSSGDHKRLDFLAYGHGVNVAMEVKWARSAHPNINEDIKKLTHIPKRKDWVALLCFFGRWSDVSQITLPPAMFRERGKAVIADLRLTKYACRIYELRTKYTGTR
jgi:hypothetical protein